MKKGFALISVVLMIIFSNYQIYAQLLCHQSKCCGCCPSERNDFTPCKCDVGNDQSNEHPQNFSVITVTKAYVRLFYQPVALHSTITVTHNSILHVFRKSNYSLNDTSLTLSAFQIPLRI